MVIMQIHLGTAGISNNGIISEALTNGLQKDHLQITAMNGKLRPIVTSRHPGGLAINELAKAVEKYGFFGTYADLIQGFKQPQLVKFAGGMRQNVDAHPQGLDLADCFVYPAGNARLMQT